ncbi:MAG: PIN domain-containing protein [Acidobacteria bacterium]|nr:PIN domain-containing protein [Acidobacteriota bacterium]
MSVKRRPPKPTPKAAFWDTSAIVPLCCFQPRRDRAHMTARVYGRQVTWWATSVEAVSSLVRLRRENALSKEGRQQALDRLNRLRRAWAEIQPTDEVRDLAERLLGIHRLRAADALQLAAAHVWCQQRPRGRAFIGADGGLSDAAEAEGFTVIRLL